MNSLRDLQHACYRAFALGDAAALLPAVRANGIPPALRIEVYRNNHREGRRKALTASFPAVERLVGESCFTGLARRYAREHPSRCGDLQQYGARFAAFLDGVYADSRFRWLTDVARLEWAVEEVHLEPDEPPLERAALSRFGPEQYGDLVFAVRRAVRFVESRFPVLSIWRANQPGNDARVDLDRGGENVFAARRGDGIHLGLLDANAFALASALAHRRRLTDAWSPGCDAVAAGRAHDAPDPAAAPDLAAALGAILDSGLFAGVAAADPLPVRT